MRKLIFLISILLLGSLSQANGSFTLVHFPIMQGQDLIGQATQIGPRTYLTSAHVMSSLSREGYERLLAQLQLPLNTTVMYQFFLNSRYLDAVILTNQRPDHVTSFLRSHAGTTQTVGSYFVRDYFNVEDLMLERTTMGSGVVNGPYIYLNSEQNKLNLGSSGAAVLSLGFMSGEEILMGLLQCYYPGGTLGLIDGQLAVFRALTIDTLLASILRPANLTELASRFRQYDLSRCRPIDSKKGGGG